MLHKLSRSINPKFKTVLLMKLYNNSRLGETLDFNGSVSDETYERAL